MSRARLIVNPSSGTDQAAGFLTGINQSLRERFGMMEIVMTTFPRDAEAAASQAVRDGCDRVPIGLLPLGTGNDFARTLHLSEKPEEAIASLYDAREIRSDVGVLNGRAFVNTSGGGFISEVTEALDDSMTMTFARPVKVNTDGELLEAAVCRYGVMPRAARFLAGTSNS